MVLQTQLSHKDGPRGWVGGCDKPCVFGTVAGGGVGEEGAFETSKDKHIGVEREDED